MLPVANVIIEVDIKEISAPVESTQVSAVDLNRKVGFLRVEIHVEHIDVQRVMLVDDNGTAHSADGLAC